VSAGLVVDASAVLAWIFERSDPAEAKIAGSLLLVLENADALVPALWYPEVANGLLTGERRGVFDSAKSGYFLSLVGGLQITEDSARPADLQKAILTRARTYALTAYDASYLELALRSGRMLATFDRRLAAAARSAGIKVFGDTP
jgi:predicted nucleic acid-binding protein